MTIPNQQTTELVLANGIKAEVVALQAVIDDERAAQGIAAPQTPTIGQIVSETQFKLTELSREQLAEMGRRSVQFQQDKRNRNISETFMALRSAVGSDCSRFTLDEYRIETPEQRRVVESLREYLSDVPARMDAGQGLILFGPCGTGKDHLAFSVAREFVQKHGINTRWVNCQDWFGRIRDNMDSARSEAGEVSALSGPPLVVLSDPLPPFGELSQFQANMLYRVMLGRSYSRRPTIVTINVASDDEADRRLGVPTWDRMCAGAWKLFCQWPSFRRAARKVNC